MELARADRDAKVAPRRLLERIHVDRAVALVTEQLDQGRATFFLRGLDLAVGNTQQVHLERLDEESLGIPTIGTRQRQIDTPSRAMNVARQESIALFAVSRDAFLHGIEHPRLDLAPSEHG